MVDPAAHPWGRDRKRRTGQPLFITDQKYLFPVLSIEDGKK
jgi:hypothetical protein